MAQFAGGLVFSSANPVRFDAPPARLETSRLRLTLKRKPTVVEGDAVEMGALVGAPTEADPVGVVSPIAGRVSDVLAWREGAKDRFDVSIEPADGEAETSVQRPAPMGRDHAAWTKALGACGPWPEFGLGLDLVRQLAGAQRRRPAMVICIGLDALSAYPDRSTLLRNFPDDAALGLKVLAEVVGAGRSRLVADANLPGLRRVRRRCRNFGVRFAAAENVYPAADPTLIVGEHGPRRIAAKGLPYGANPVEHGVLLTTPWTVIRLARWVTRGRLDMVRPAMVGWSSPGQPIAANWVFPGQALGTLAAALTGKAADLRGRAVVGHPMTGQAITTPTGPEGPLPPTVPEDEQLVCLVTEPVAPVPEPCIHCGWCAEVCPTRLEPIRLAELAARGVSDKRVSDPLAWCIACGLCTHVCPTHLPLAQTLNQARHEEGAA